MRLSISESVSTGSPPCARVIDIAGALIERAMQERAIAIAKYGTRHFPTSVLTAYEILSSENQQIITAIGQSANTTMGIEGVVVDSSQ